MATPFTFSPGDTVTIRSGRTTWTVEEVYNGSRHVELTLSSKHPLSPIVAYAECCRPAIHEVAA